MGIESVCHRLITVVVAVSAIQSINVGRPVNVQKSSLTVSVYKAGLFSAFADNHRITAPIRTGTLSDASPLAISIVVSAGDLKVVDENLGTSARAEVQSRMLGPEVLDTARFSTITFSSTRIDPAGPDRWNISGHLTIHGVDRVVTFPAVRAGDRYRGEVAVKQSDFGIKPIRIAGGTVRVKDEVKVEFEIAVR